MIYRLLIVSLVCASLLPLYARAAEPDPEVLDLAKLLESRNAPTVNKAATAVWQRLNKNPVQWAGDARQYWLKALQNAKHFELAESMAFQALLTVPSQTGDVEYFQEIRVRSFLATGDFKEALSQARALFNVCGMKNTEKALRLVVDCLHAAGKVESIMPFAKEQYAAAVTRAPTEPPSPPGLLATIELDAKPYEGAFQLLKHDDNESYLGRANLMLLCGAPQEALEVFKKIVPRNDSDGQVQFHENIARAIRAQDGNIGRANGYMLAVPEESLNPKEKQPGKF